MANRSARALLAACFLFHAVAALRVSPNSPCLSVCVASDDESSSTSPSEIVCGDADVESTKEGKRFKTCLSCLEDSTHREDGESDQGWFLYNLRYTIDYCLMNATEEESTCLSTRACGPLSDAITRDLESPREDQYAYCDVDGGIMLGEQVDNCFTCVRAGGDQSYLSNFLTALKTGCEQASSSDETLNLNDTVFAATKTKSLNKKRSSPSSASQTLSTAAIAGIAVGGGVALILVAAAAAFFYLRRRRNSGDSLHSEPSHERKGVPRATSPLSFRCQTHLTPLTPDFPSNLTPEFPPRSSSPEQGYVDPSAALRSNPVTPSKWSTKRFSAKTARKKSFIAEKKRKSSVSEKKRSIVERIRPVEPTPPLPSHSPAMPTANIFTGSPYELHGTPSSTVSVWSNGPLNAPPRPRRPDSRTAVNSFTSIAGLAITSFEGRPATPNFTFPGMAVSTPPAPPTPQSPYSSEKEVCWMGRPSMDGPASPVKRKGTFPMVGSPVEVMNMRTEFPPPPTPKK